MDFLELTPGFLVWIAIVIAFFLICYKSTKKAEESFRKRFPPISDAEFLARCTPGTDPAIALKVRKIVADTLGVEYERIYPSTRFVDDLGAD